MNRLKDQSLFVLSQCFGRDLSRLKAFSANAFKASVEEKQKTAPRERDAVE
jgi:hypothetical protein